MQISCNICTPEDQLDRFSINAQATNWIEVTKKNTLACWIINLLQDVFCIVSLRLFYSFVFRLVFQARQNTAQLVKILSDTTQQNV